MKKYHVIVIDGPAGSGKSSTAKLLASKLGFIYLDTGAMYRCVALAARNKNIDLNNEDEVSRIAYKINFNIVPYENDYEFYLNDENVTLKIREQKIDAGSSLVSSYKKVREAMVELQKQFAYKGNIVAEGRDMGTVVFPAADLKIYLVADLETRAIRRARQLAGVGLETSIEEQVESLSSRDLFDSNRTHSPLKKAHDAIEIDTTNMSLNEQVGRVYELALERLNIS